VGDVMRTQD